MTRCARDRRVYFVEEPIFEPGVAPELKVEVTSTVTVVVPHLPAGCSDEECLRHQQTLMDSFMKEEKIRDFVLWYYTPMALPMSHHWSPRAIVYDCMDEHSGFQGAPSTLMQWEASLMKRAHLVLTGGQSLYEAKRHAHHNIHPFPSSVDVPHFAQARRPVTDPEDQIAIPQPRLGFFGVVDERMDLALLGGMAAARPDWHIIVVGPVVKIDPASLPQRPNLHYLGSKSYTELPRYIAGWDVALMPFARNAATAFISPTKTPEYLAAGKPVVSTSIRDVVEPYGRLELVRIADDVPGFVRACAAALADQDPRSGARADEFLRHTSWDDTWWRIRALVDKVTGEGPAAPIQRQRRRVSEVVSTVTHV